MASGYLRGISAPYVPSNRDKKYRPGRKKDSSFASDRHELNNGAQVQNVKAARVYVFGDSNLVEDEEQIEFEMPVMTNRHRGARAFARGPDSDDDQPTYFEKEIDEGETLQAIALKYACPVSELKRLNNLIQDQEFFALKVLKVPIKKHGILSEQIAKRSALNFPLSHSKGAEVHSPVSDGDSYTNYFEDSDSHPDLSDPETQIKVMRTLSIRDNLSSQAKESEKFLQKMDSDLAKLKQDSRKERESLSEVISVLTNKSFHPLERSNHMNKHNGADCGISWWSIMVYSLIVGIFLPIVFLIYFFIIKKS
ncbi:lysm and putative peptidoglycan-binding domain-containing protein 3 [Plakobranchus ocellatus]|uniref:Lysm and putative peptidoglycan-binding domain-containing protein 3 n=1 Tax=Plakobranchus ocellatus TaxID=259542 RepID=A0AAV4D9Y9_9GAST|nr:lysm and putative peptidoglycan-binding domain-containing protein 3 [Plakobranchus ocellatus]